MKFKAKYVSVVEDFKVVAFRNIWYTNHEHPHLSGSTVNDPRGNVDQ